MTRHKKSRKPGVAPRSSIKEDKKKTVEIADKKPKKFKGKAAGNRQQEAVNKHQKGQASTSQKDPRIGSKTPIVLTTNPSQEKAPALKAKAKNSPIAAVKVIDNNAALEQELYAIEDDEKLQDILNKQELDQPLSKDEVAYFNEKMDRHQELREQLGWSDDEDEPEASEQSGRTKNTKDIDEDALWDKLDNSTFSDFD